MRRLAIVMTVLFVLVAGGALTALLNNGGGLESLLPFLRQTSDPAASPTEAEAWQLEQFIIMIGFILFNLIGIGVTIAGIFWFLNRGVLVSRAEAEEKTPAQTSK